MKKILVLTTLLSCLLSFAQKEMKFSIQQIDSISKKYGRDFITDGKITSNNENGDKTGTGGFSYQTYLYNPDFDNYEKLSKSEKKVFNLKKKQVLVKAKYHCVIHYNENFKDSSEEITAEFYYTNSALFFVKILERTYKGDAVITSSSHEIKFDPNSQSSITPELNKWIKVQNAIILKYYKDNVNTK